MCSGEPSGTQKWMWVQTIFKKWKYRAGKYFEILKCDKTMSYFSKNMFKLCTFFHNTIFYTLRNIQQNKRCLNIPNMCLHFQSFWYFFPHSLFWRWLFCNKSEVVMNSSYVGPIKISTHWPSASNGSVSELPHTD